MRRRQSPAESPTVLSVVGAPRSSGSLNDNDIKGNTMLPRVLDLWCVGRDVPAPSGPSDFSRASNDVEEDEDSIEWRFGEWRRVGERVGDDSDVRACS